MSSKIEVLTDVQWEQVRALRGEYVAWGLCTDAPDRAAAEGAIAGMYARIGRPAPRFVWTDSPATGALACAVLRDASLSASLGDSLRVSLSASLRDSLRDSLGVSLWDSLRVSLRDSLGDSLSASLGVSLRDSLSASLSASLRDSLSASLGDSLRDSLGVSLRDSLLWSAYFEGQHEWWPGWYDIPRRMGLVTYKPEHAAVLDLWVALARSCGCWWPHEDVCVISGRPSVVRTETWNAASGTIRLHCADGPALAYADGWALHAWHGVAVPARLIEGEPWDLPAILREPNSEVRRAAIEKAGWDRLEGQLGAPVAQCPDPGNPGRTLALYDVPDGVFEEPVRVVLMTNGSPDRSGALRRYGETVPASITDPVSAQAWAWDVAPETYAALARRT